MSTALAGTVEATADPFSAFTAYVSNGFDVDSTGTYAYFGSRSFSNGGGIVRLKISDMSMSLIYPVGFFTGDIYVLFLSGDGLTLYAMTGTGIFSALVDGTSGSPTSISSVTSIAWVSYLAASGRHYVHSTHRAIEYIDLGTGLVTNEWRYVANAFWGAPGACRFASNSILIGASAEGAPGYILQYNRDNGHAKVLVGSGVASTTGSVGSGPFDTDTQGYIVDSDADGRIYWVETGGSFRMLDAGVVTAPGTLTCGTFRYVPSINKAILNNGDTIRRVS